MICTTEAVVLHARRYGESSKIVALYTREHGRVSVIARGAMQTRTGLAAALQPMSVISAVIYLREGRDLQNLARAEPLVRLTRLHSNLERMAAALAILELVSATMHGEERNDRLFETIVEALRALDAPQTSAGGVQLWFTIRLAEILGYALRTDACGVCEEPVTPSSDGVSYSLALGAPLCAEHRESVTAWDLTPGSYRLLATLAAVSAEGAATSVGDAPDRSGLNDALVAFVRHHVEGLRRLNVGGVMRDVLGRDEIPAVAEGPPLPRNTSS